MIEAEPNDDQNTATRFEGVDGPERRDRQARGRRPLRLPGQEGAELQHPRLRPPAPLAARLGHLHRQEGRRGPGRQRRRAELARQHASGSPPPRTPSTSSRSPTTSRRAAPTTSTGSRSTSAVPLITLSVAEESLQRGIGPTAVAVPKGNRQAVLVNARRAETGGAIKVDLEGLPAGTTATSDEMAANQPTLPVLIEAKADAPLAGALVRGRGQAGRPEARRPLRVPPVVGAGPRPEQRSCTGPGAFDRLAVAVTEEVAVLDRGRRAQGPAGPGRVDGPEGRRQAQARLHGPDRRLSALEPARASARRAASRSPRRRTRRSIPMNADGGAALADLADRGQRHGRHARRAGHGLVAAGQALGRRPVPDACPTSRRASSKGRRPTWSSP